MIKLVPKVAKVTKKFEELPMGQLFFYPYTGVYYVKCLYQANGRYEWYAQVVTTGDLYQSSSFNMACTPVEGTLTIKDAL